MTAPAHGTWRGLTAATHDPRYGTLTTCSAGQVGNARSAYVTVARASAAGTATGTHRERAHTQ